MPYTLAHPILVAPLRRTELVMPALVIGSMVPDLPHFVSHLPYDYFYAHSLPGLVTADLAAGMILLALWQLLVFPAYEATVPAPLRRWESPSVPSWRWWAAAVPSVIVGALTHLGLDQYTHGNSELMRALPFTAQRLLFGWTAATWIQVVASALGLLAVILWCWRLWRTGAPSTSARQASTVERVLLWAVPLAVGALATAANVIQLWWLYTNMVTFRSYVWAVTVTGGRWAMLSILLLSAWFQGRRWLAHLTTGAARGR